MLAIREAATDAGVRVNELARIGVGSPGSVDSATGTVQQAANIDGMSEPFALGPALAKRLGVPVVVGNDVSVAAEAERRLGAGRGLRSFLGVFWGTGIGGGLVVDGRLLHGRGSAGEIGHTCVKPGGRRCNCGLRGCLEAYAGRAALEERARREARKRKTVLFDLQQRRGREALTSGVWLRALEAGDAGCAKLARGGRQRARCGRRLCRDAARRRGRRDRRRSRGAPRAQLAEADREGREGPHVLP